MIFEAHAAKGGSTSLGATEVAQACEALEDEAAARVPEHALKLIESLREKYQTATEELQRLVAAA